MMLVCYYLLRVILYTGVLWGIYRLLLHRRASPGAARLFLLLATGLPFVWPLLHWQPLADAIPQSFQVRLPAFAATGAVTHSNNTGDLWPLAGILYGCISLVLLGWGIGRHWRFRQFLLRQRTSEVRDQRLFMHTGLGPGTYGRWIFLPAGDVPDQVLAHEQAHIRHGHRCDLLYLQLLKVLCWPNLFLYAIAADLKLVHEYQADEQAAVTGTDHYIAELLNGALGTKQFSFAHAFFHPSIKNRIMMLQHPVNRQKSIYRLAVAGIFTSLLFTAAVYAQSARKAAPAKAQEQILSYVEQMPVFNGDLSQWLGAHIKYPEPARKGNAQGKAMIKFVVTDAGKVRNVALTKSTGNKYLDQEAMRVVTSMPDWKPGRQSGKPVNVYFTLPIAFKLEG